MRPRFVLIHSPEGIKDARKRLTVVEPPLPSRRLAARVGKRLRNISNELLGLSSGFATFQSAVPSHQEAPREIAPELVVPVTVGVWSLNAWLGDLAELIEALNRSQSAFVFYEVEATIPAGLISRPERVIPWLTKVLGKRLNKKTEREIVDNLIANDFFGLAEGIRADLGLNYLIGITPSMVAEKSDGTIYWNHFSTFEGHTILASSYQLREFAQSADRPFEAFLTKIITSQILVAMFFPRLGFHSDRGCLFDYDASRISLIDKVLDPKIEPNCLDKIEPQYQAAAVSFVDFIRSFGGAKP